MNITDGIFNVIDHVVDAIASLWPVVKDPSEKQHDPRAYGIRVNGIDLPPMVVDQIRIAGFNAQWLSQYELAAAKRGAALDCQVFDEPDGDNFLDNLEVDGDEAAERNKKAHAQEAEDGCPGGHHTGDGFCSKIKKERAEKKSAGHNHGKHKP